MPIQQKSAGKRILVDGREFTHHRFTGIARVLTGFLDALLEWESFKTVFLTLTSHEVLPQRLRDRAKLVIVTLPKGFLRSESCLSSLTRQQMDFFLSPYPKLPLFGCHTKAVHIIHDVLDLTHPHYRRRLKAAFDGYRLKKALYKADLTWYASSWSLNETQRYVGYTGRNPKVRYPAIGEEFACEGHEPEDHVSMPFGLARGYILCIGNGRPHKNLGVVLEVTEKISRKIVFVGVSRQNQSYWQRRHPGAKATWIDYISDQDLLHIIKKAFCLVQPSTAEGYAYPPLEAMASGIPAIVSNIPVLVETTGGNALLADPHRPSEWIKHMVSLEAKDLFQAQVEKGLRWTAHLKGRQGWKGHLLDLEALMEKRGILQDETAE